MKSALRDTTPQGHKKHADYCIMSDTFGPGNTSRRKSAGRPGQGDVGPGHEQLIGPRVDRIGR